MATKESTRLLARCDLCGETATDPTDWSTVTFTLRPLGTELDEEPDSSRERFDVCATCAREAGIARMVGPTLRVSVRAAWNALKRRIGA